MSRIGTSTMRGCAGGRSSGRVTRRYSSGLDSSRVGQSVTQNVLPWTSLFRHAMGMWRGSLQAPSGLVHQEVDDGPEVARGLERGQLAVRAGGPGRGPRTQEPHLLAA